MVMYDLYKIVRDFGYPITVFFNLGITIDFVRRRKLKKLEPSIYTGRLCAAVL